jgi:hypothetical protein
MWERGCFPATILEQLRRPCRPRHPYAVPRTSLQCVCTRRRNCIAQSSPCREYALRTVDFPARNSATIELTHYPHGSGSGRRSTFANSSPENSVCANVFRVTQLTLLYAEACLKRANRRHRPVGSASIRSRAERPPRGGRASDDARISGLASRVILVNPQGHEGTGEAQRENAGSRYGDQVN